MNAQPTSETKVEKTKPIWVAWTNTDLTEGRGWNIPLHIAESPETAARLGRKGSVMGSDCHVTQEIAVQIGGKWLAPAGRIHTETKEDTAARLKREAREAAIGKAKASGLSDDDIAAMVGDR